MSTFGFTECGALCPIFAGVGYLLLGRVIHLILESEKELKALDERGEYIMAIVTNKTLEKVPLDGNGHSMTFCRLDYRFQIITSEGSDSPSTITRATCVHKVIWGEVEVGDSIQVIYDPEDPQFNEMRAQYDKIVGTENSIFFTLIKGLSILSALAFPVGVIWYSPCLHTGHFWMDVLGTLYIVVFLGVVFAFAVVVVLTVVALAFGFGCGQKVLRMVLPCNAVKEQERRSKKRRICEP